MIEDGSGTEVVLEMSSITQSMLCGPVMVALSALTLLALVPPPVAAKLANGKNIDVNELKPAPGVAIVSEENCEPLVQRTI